MCQIILTQNINLQNSLVEFYSGQSQLPSESPQPRSMRASIRETGRGQGRLFGSKRGGRSASSQSVRHLLAVSAVYDGMGGTLRPGLGGRIGYQQNGLPIGSMTTIRPLPTRDAAPGPPSLTNQRGCCASDRGKGPLEISHLCCGVLYQAARVESHAAFLAFKRQAGFYAP